MSQGPFGGIAPVLSNIFGGPITFARLAGGTVDFTGIFRNLPVRIQTPDGGEIMSTIPSLRLHRVDARQLEEGDTFTADGETYAFLSYEAPENPSPDALVSCQIEVAT
jgi:hypothetical protein